MKDLYKLVINGKPVVQQRPRRGKWGNFYDPSKKERDKLALALSYARIGAKMPILETGVHVYAYFYGTGGRCDLDNCLKALLDSGNKVLWKDDRQITQIHAVLLRNDAQPRTEIEVIPVQ